MNVTLNGEPFDLTLERERTVGELLSGIERWLEGARFSVSAFSVNGRAVEAEEVEAACAMDLDEVESLDVRATSWNGLYSQALAEFVGALEDAAEERRAARVSGGRPNTVAIAERFASGAAAGFMEAGAKDLVGRFIAASEGKTGDPDAEIAALRSEAAERLRELGDPAAELSALKVRLPQMAERLEAVPLELQTGKDGQAAATLGDFASVVGKLMRLLPLAEEAGAGLGESSIDGKPFGDFMDDLRTALKELTAGYENGDAILVGDLAEYELAPRLRGLADALGNRSIEKT